MQEQGLVEQPARALAGVVDIEVNEESNPCGEGAPRPRKPSLREGCWFEAGMVIRPGKGGRFPEEAMAN